MAGTSPARTVYVDRFRSFQNGAMGRAMNLAITMVLAAAVSAAGAPVPKGPHCPLVRKPVCAVTADGTRIQAVNACVAEGWKHARVLHEGACAAPGNEPMMCNMLYQPVCATDPATKAGKTYPNLCHAEVANATVLHDGQCAGGKSGE